MLKTVGQWIMRIALAATMFIASNAVAQTCFTSAMDLPAAGLVADYVTDITDADLRNSNGARLHGFRQILQQDRYNTHERGQIDGTYLDNGVFEPFQPESFFTTPARRSLFASADLSMVCPDDLRSLTGQIERGRLDGFLYVRVYQDKADQIRVFLALVG
jgi:hypothetical protein